MVANPHGQRAGLWLFVLVVSVSATLGDRSTTLRAADVAVPPMTYTNLASAAMVRRAQAISQSFTAGGFLPAESFTNPIVLFEGQSIHPSGRVFGSVGEYHFRDGMLWDMRRRDLYREDGGVAPIIGHLTNETLTLSLHAATGRAMQALQRLDYETNRLAEFFNITVADNKMDAYPVRNGGPGFPMDLHFYGELISREKIKIMVEMRPLDQARLANTRTANLHLSVRLLATTGELLEISWLPDSEALSALQMGGPEPITIEGATDLQSPVFFSATRTLTSAEAVATSLDAASIVRDGWKDLQSNLGTNRPAAVLICDNLNDPRVVAKAMKSLAGEIPWAGISRSFRFDLPFDRARIEKLAQGNRGLRLLAICGPVESRIELLGNLESRPVPPRPKLEDEREPDALKRVMQRQEEQRRSYEEDRRRLSPRLDDLLARLDLPESLPDHAIVLIEGAGIFPWSSLVHNELQSRLRGKATVGSPDAYSPGTGFTYFNGEVLTNAIAVLRLSGSLPLQFDTFGALRAMNPQLSGFTNLSFSSPPDPETLAKLQARTQSRVVSGEVTRPIYDTVATFGIDPLENVEKLFSVEGIHLLQDAEKLEVFEIKQAPPQSFLRASTSPPATGQTLMEGHPLVARGETLGNESAREFGAALLIDDSSTFGNSSCIWKPVIVFRAWRGKEHASLVACFQCTEAEFRYYDADGKLVHETIRFPFWRARTALLRLARQALPDSAVLRGVTN